MRFLATTALGLSLALGAGAAAAQTGVLRDWKYDDLYAKGVSVEEMLDGMDVNGTEEQDIGEVEDVLIGPDGKVISVIAEVGGFWDMGDTHISIPWDQVDLANYADGITVPITEDNADDYSLFDREVVSKAQVEDQVVSEVDSAEAMGGVWRASELVGDYARVRDGDAWSDYGYVSDMIIRDGEIAAVIVTPDVTWDSAGYRAYPWAVGPTGWRPADRYYNLPYDREEVMNAQVFDYDELNLTAAE